MNGSPSAPYRKTSLWVVHGVTNREGLNTHGVIDQLFLFQSVGGPWCAHAEIWGLGHSITYTENIP